MALELLLPQFSFLFFFNPPILTIQLPQFSFLTFLFLAISLSKFFFLSPTSVVTPFLSPLSYFFSEFRQHHCRNLLLSSFYQISLNSTHIINNLHFLQYSAKRLAAWDLPTRHKWPMNSMNLSIKWEVANKYEQYES